MQSIKLKQPLTKKAIYQVGKKHRLMPEKVMNYKFETQDKTQDTENTWNHMKHSAVWLSNKSF